MVAAIQDGVAVLAADGQVTDRESKILATRRLKVVPLTRNIVVGVSGNATVGIAALREVLRSETPLSLDFLEEWHDDYYPLLSGKWGILKNRITEKLHWAIAQWPAEDAAACDPVIVLAKWSKGSGRVCVWHQREGWEPIEFAGRTGIRHVFKPEGPLEIQQEIDRVMKSNQPILKCIRAAVRISAEYEETRDLPRTNRHLAILNSRWGFTVRWEEV